MKRIFCLFLLCVISTPAISQPSNYCGDVKRMRVWAKGSDTYGIWVEFSSNPEACPGGFYMPHTAANKQYAYSLILAAKAAKEKVCIQTYPNASDWKIGSRCQINYVMHP